MNSGRPAQRAAQYMIVAPSQEPMVPAMIMPVTLSGIWPVCAKCAAGGMITSLGSGRMELSAAIKSAMSGYPPVVKAFMYQSMMCLNMRGGYSGKGAERNYFGG